MPTRLSAKPTVVLDVTVQAYRETEYRVYSSPMVCLRLDVVSKGLAQLHAEHGVLCSTFITACNPYSQLLSDVENLWRQANLKNELLARGYLVYEGEGVHPHNCWPREPSFLVPGLGPDDAAEFGVLFDQNAVLCSGADAVPRLILLR